MARSLKSPSDKQWHGFAERVRECSACSLRTPSKKPVVGSGPPNANLMVVGTGPGRHEVLHSKPFAGARHNVLQHAFASAGMSIDRVRLTNLVRCRVVDGQWPTREQTQVCHAHLREEIELVEPEVIIATGEFAACVLYGRQITLQDVAGFRLSIAGKITLVPTYDPADALRGGWSAARDIQRHIATAVAVAAGRLQGGAAVLDEVRRTQPTVAPKV